MIRRPLFIISAIALMLSEASAYDITATNDDGTMLYFNDLGSGKAELTAKDRVAPTPGYEGDLEIPQHITYMGFDYEVTAIGDYAFAWCNQLCSLSLPETIVGVGRNAFEGCFDLEKFTVSSSNPSIWTDGKCLYQSSATTGDDILLACAPAAEGQYEIHSGTAEIGKAAFGSCPFLTGIEIPSSVKVIDDYAFYFCNFISRIEIPAETKEIGRSAFSDCLSLEAIDVNTDNPWYRSVDGVLLSGDGKTLLQSPGATAANAVIPEGVAAIGPEAFFRNYGITNVNIPATVTAIGDCSFIDCGRVASVQIPHSVSAIGYAAFGMCTGLETLYLAGADPSEIALGDNVFTDVDTESCTLFVPYGSESAYASAPQWRDFTNIKGYDALLPQEIKWAEYGDTIETHQKVKLQAVATSGLPVKYALAPSCQHLAIIQDDELTVLVPGIVTVYAYQSGNVMYSPAPATPITFHVGISGAEDIAADDNIVAYGTKSAILIQGAAPEHTARVYDLTGRLIYEGTDRVIPVHQSGIYIVNVASRGFKVATR